MQDLFRNTFPLDGKMKLSVAGVSENGGKKMVFTNQKNNQEKGYFSKIVFPLSGKKSSSKRYCFKETENRFPLAGNCLHWQKYQKNQRKLLPIAVIRALNRLLYNLNNSFH